MGDPSAGLWEPLSLGEVATLFAAANFPWWVAGGYAIELAVGRAVRSHSDVDVLILRRDHVAARKLLGAWDCWASDPPGRLRPWPAGEHLRAGVHDVWCRERPASPWRVQIMLDDSHGARWQSRRDLRICKPIDALGRRTEDGLPYLTPEVQLYYKAKAPRPHDEVDLEAVLPVLGRSQREWLKGAICTSYGEDHPWIVRISSTAR